MLRFRQITTSQKIALVYASSRNPLILERYLNGMQALNTRREATMPE